MSIDDRERRLRTAKLPDFVSRLKGFVNLMGPNRQTVPARVGPREYVKADPYYVMRRAILLRGILEKEAPHIIRRVEGKHAGIAQIDRGLLRALLGVWEYKHGARSIGAIVAMSQLAGKASFQRSSLPAEDQLSLHVNGREFYGLLIQQLQLDEREGVDLERLAEAYHSNYCDVQRLLKRPVPKPWSELNESGRLSSRESVRAFPHQLAAIGHTYLKVQDAHEHSVEQIPEDDVERLAELEHDRWMVAQFDRGWVWGKRKDADADPKTHPDLVPYRSMPAEELADRYPPALRQNLGQGPLLNKTDEEMVRRLPQILKAAGLALVKVVP